ncbi:MAG TPA: c-type cytochrome [Thermodesulfovibrionales bacterium]|jgi:cytochrome c oxidase cbb3-type subunit 3|nr:c-type cytochrome [Thermodesulfovibrionales bacterium]
MKRTMMPVLLLFISLMLQAGIVQSEPALAQKNPYEGDPRALQEGAEIFKKNCQVCHGAGGRGDICPNLTLKSKKYGDSDADLYLTISKGRPGGMPNWENSLGQDRIWKVITYIRSIEQK